jgi:ribonuclease Z
MTESARELLAEQLKGVKTVVCESQYRHADLHLAEKHYHMTAIQVAEIARQAGIGKLMLFHLSDRYTTGEHQEILEEARTVFPDTFFPDHWNI